MRFPLCWLVGTFCVGFVLFCFYTRESPRLFSDRWNCNSLQLVLITDNQHFLCLIECMIIKLANWLIFIEI